MKKLLKIGIGLVILVVGGVALLFYLTGDLTDSAQHFFTAVKARDYTTAYQYVSSDFRASTAQDELITFLEQSALLQFKEATWNNRSIAGNRGQLDGSITTEDGGVVPIKLSLIKENGKWLIFAIAKPAAGLATGQAGQLPSAAEQVALVQESMQQFAAAVNAKDFSEFHTQIAYLWQQQMSVQQFDETFKSFMENNINLLPLQDFAPVFEGAPTIDESGIMVIKGHYPTQPSQVIFEFKYIYEGIQWKLIGTSVKL